MSLFRVLEAQLPVAEAIEAVSAPHVGGIDLFLGVVRDHNDGRAVTRLEYHAYVSMAEKEMQRIAAEIERELPGVKLAALHRIGSLAVGDLAVVCAAGAVHRGEAFTACRALRRRARRGARTSSRARASAMTRSISRERVPTKLDLRPYRSGWQFHASSQGLSGT